MSYHSASNVMDAQGLMMQAALPYLEADGGGAVVNISGVAAQRPFTSMLPYCCAK